VSGTRSPRPARDRVPPWRCARESHARPRGCAGLPTIKVSVAWLLPFHDVDLDSPGRRHSWAERVLHQASKLAIRAWLCNWLHIGRGVGIGTTEKPGAAMRTRENRRWAGNGGVTSRRRTPRSRVGFLG